jgi:short subunit dehydrogenase-like uncharacterized protein
MNQILTLAERAQGRLLLYGCYGYTGELIANLFHKYKLQDLVVIGGRDFQKVNQVAEQYQFKHVLAFSLDLAPNDIDSKLDSLNIKAVVHCAGPFTFTAKQMIDACVRTGKSYMDITGELDVFEYSLSNADMNQKAQQQQIVIMSGVGLDIVPSDCLLQTISQEFKNRYNQIPHQLYLANDFGSQNKSHGSLKTGVTMATKPDYIRKDGEITSVPKFFSIRKFNFPQKKKEVECVSITWGDNSTALYSTGVKNIISYLDIPAPPSLVIWFLNLLIVQVILSLILRLPLVVPALNKLIELLVPKGPNEAMRNTSQVEFAAEAMERSGEKVVRGSAIVCEAYEFTARCAVLSSLKVLAKDVKKFGCVTPSLAFGADFVLEIDGSKVSVEK